MQRHVQIIHATRYYVERKNQNRFIRVSTINKIPNSSTFTLSIIRYFRQWSPRLSIRNLDARRSIVDRNLNQPGSRFGLKFCFNREIKFYEDKRGITFIGVVRGAHSTLSNRANKTFYFAFPVASVRIDSNLNPTTRFRGKLCDHVSRGNTWIERRGSIWITWKYFTRIETTRSVYIYIYRIVARFLKKYFPRYATPGRRSSTSLYIYRVSIY